MPIEATNTKTVKRSIRLSACPATPTLLLALALTGATSPKPATSRAGSRWMRAPYRPGSTAKFGIFIHWGVYSVPAWAAQRQLCRVVLGRHAEQERRHLAVPHETYGANFKYQDFAPRFTAELFEPDQWADIFARSGARYVV